MSDRSTLVIVLACLVLARCAEPERSPAGTKHTLASVPLGDQPWRDAFSSVDASSRAALCTEVEAISRAHPQRWEPVWATTFCLRDPEPARITALLQPALELARVQGSQAGISVLADALAWSAFSQGKPREAELLFDQARTAARLAQRLDLEAYAENDFAGFLVERGRLAEARERLDRTAAALATLGMESERRAVQLNAAIVQYELGNLVSASRGLAVLLDEYENSHETEPLDVARLALGNIAMLQENVVAARQHFESVSSSFPYLVSRAHLGLGRIALRAHDLGGAISHFNAAITAVPEPRSPSVLHARALLSKALGLKGDQDSAVVLAREVAALADESVAEEPAWTARWVGARILQTLNRQSDAVRLLREAVASIERQSMGLDPSGEGASFLRERAEPYVSLALALATGASPDLPESFAVIGRLHARGLRHALSDGGSPEPIALRDLQRALGRDEALIAVALGDEEGIAIAVDRERAFGRVLPGRRALLPLIERMRDDLIAGRSSDAAAVLSQQLLAPMLSELNAATRLYLVADRELSRIPFVALPDPAQPSEPLGARREIALMPYAGAPPRWSAERGPVLLAGAPRFDRSSPWRELPWSAYELSHLRTLWGDSNSTLITADAFTARSLQDASLHKFRTIHLATHAVASTLDPTECGIIASHDERIGIDRVIHLPLTDALVVLSACRTGEGEAIPGQGIVGLTWATMLAGARGVIASQWSVDDSASARLMLALHQHLKEGVDPVHALALAQREIRATQKSPAIWAAHMAIVRAAAPADQDRRTPREKTSPNR